MDNSSKLNKWVGWRERGRIKGGGGLGGSGWEIKNSNDQ